jgi:hypothetical protein
MRPPSLRSCAAPTRPGPDLAEQEVLEALLGREVNPGGVARLHAVDEPEELAPPSSDGAPPRRTSRSPASLANWRVM